MDQWDQWENQEASRLANIMARDPNCAANELRMEIQQIPANRALELVHKTQAYSSYYPGSAGQVYETPITYGACDTGQRHISVQTAYGGIDVANIQARPPVCETPHIPLPRIDIHVGERHDRYDHDRHDHDRHDRHDHR